MAPVLREEDPDMDPYIIYDIYRRRRNYIYFTVKLYHDGEFTRKPVRVYKGGVVDYFDLCEVDRFSLHAVNKMLEELGIAGMFFYFYRVPHMDLDNGLRPLQCESDVIGFLEFASTNYEMEVYLSDNIIGVGDVIDKMLVPKYNHGASASGVVIEELDNEDDSDQNPQQLVIVPIGKLQQERSCQQQEIPLGQQDVEKDNIVEENLEKDYLNAERLSDRETSSENFQKAINVEHISASREDDIQRRGIGKEFADGVRVEEEMSGAENGSVDVGAEKISVAAGVEESVVVGAKKRSLVVDESGLIFVKNKRLLVKELPLNKRMLMVF